MAFTQAQLDALRAAYAEGALEVQYDGRRIRYASRSDMRQRIAEIERSLGQRAKGPVRKVMTTRRGLHPSVQTSFDGGLPLDG